MLKSKVRVYVKRRVDVVHVVGAAAMVFCRRRTKPNDGGGFGFFVVLRLARSGSSELPLNAVPSDTARRSRSARWRANNAGAGRTARPGPARWRQNYTRPVVLNNCAVVITRFAAKTAIRAYVRLYHRDVKSTASGVRIPRFRPKPRRQTWTRDGRRRRRLKGARHVPRLGNPRRPEGTGGHGRRKR